MLGLPITEVRRRCSELVKRASGGERVAITPRGQRVAFLESAQPAESLKEIFARMEKIRKSFRLPKGVTMKSLSEEGRT